MNTKTKARPKHTITMKFEKSGSTYIMKIDSTASDKLTLWRPIVCAGAMKALWDDLGDEFKMVITRKKPKDTTNTHKIELQSYQTVKFCFSRYEHQTFTIYSSLYEYLRRFFNHYESLYVWCEDV